MKIISLFVFSFLFPFFLNAPHSLPQEFHCTGSAEQFPSMQNRGGDMLSQIQSEITSSSAEVDFEVGQKIPLRW